MLMTGTEQKAIVIAGIYVFRYIEVMMIPAFICHCVILPETADHYCYLAGKVPESTILAYLYKIAGIMH